MNRRKSAKQLAKQLARQLARRLAQRHYRRTKAGSKTRATLTDRCTSVHWVLCTVCGNQWYARHKDCRGKYPTRPYVCHKCWKHLPHRNRAFYQYRGGLKTRTTLTGRCKPAHWALCTVCGGHWHYRHKELNGKYPVGPYVCRKCRKQQTYRDALRCARCGKRSGPASRRIRASDSPVGKYVCRECRKITGARGRPASSPKAIEALDRGRQMYHEALRAGCCRVGTKWSIGLKVLIPDIAVEPVTLHHASETVQPGDLAAIAQTGEIARQSSAFPW